MPFVIGDRVRRLEDREEVDATVVEIDGENVLLEYDEGGTGWWPPEAIELID